MADKIDKLIVTNVAALRAKYNSNAARIVSQINALIAADKERSLVSKLVDVSNAAGMERLKAPVVIDPEDPRQNKTAVDAAYNAFKPDYLLIVGSGDVIAFQDLRNPLHVDGASADTDEKIWSDLPYACDLPYSREPSKFKGPTRVVGRLPDIPGDNDHAYLLKLLKTATTWKEHPREEEPSCFALSAECWRRSTQMSVDATFGPSAPVPTVPLKGPKWRKTALAPRFHFINCHGADAAPEFFGQPTGVEDFPIALQASNLPAHITEGTVVAAECCYGGQIYEVTPDAPEMGICNTYLAEKAYGVFASTTIAYGPAEGNELADLICQYFLQKVLAGASLGRAALEARQKFVKDAGRLSFVEQKTLGQFNLYGDPSITPVVPPKPASIAAKAASARGPATAAQKAVVARTAGRADRLRRRQTLILQGEALQALQTRVTRKATSTADRQMLAKEARKLKLEPGAAITCTFAPAGPRSAPGAKAVAPYEADETLHMMFAARPAKAAPAGKSKTAAKAAKGNGAADGADPAAQSRSKIAKFVLIVAKEVDGQIVEMKEFHAH